MEAKWVSGHEFEYSVALIDQLQDLCNEWSVACREGKETAERL